MKNVFRNFFSSLPLGSRLLLLAYALGLVALVGNLTQRFDFYSWLALTPALVWKGQVWRLASYAFLPAGIVDWVVSLFWLATLVSVLGKNWSALELWGYCLLAVVAGALPIVLLKSNSNLGMVSSAAMIFALLAAWYRIYGRERLILLGIGELSVRQAAILVGTIEAVILLFSCFGWFGMLAMMGGGFAGWFYLSLLWKHALGKGSRPTDLQRIARLEL